MEGWFIAKEPDDNISLTKLGKESSPQPRIYRPQLMLSDIWPKYGTLK